MAHLSIRLFGDLDVRVDDHRVEFPTRRTEALFAYLAHTGGLHTRDHLADLLWDTPTPATRSGNLRVLLTNLRRSIGDHLEISRTSVTLSPTAGTDIVVDTLDFLRRGDELLRGITPELTQPDVTALTAALDLCTGTFLSGWDLPHATHFDHWLRDERALVHDRRVSLLRELVEAELTTVSWPQALLHAQSLLELDPLNETSHQLVIRAQVLGGQLEAAVGQFEAMERMLTVEFQAAPSARSRALLAGLPAGLDTGVKRSATPAAPARPRSARPPWSRFVGRQREVARVLDKYAVATQGSGGGLLVRGEAGAGKTVLLRQVARRLLDQDPTVVVLGASSVDVAGGGDDATMAALAAQLRGEVGGPWLDGGVPPAVASRLVRARPRASDAWINGVGAAALSAAVRDLTQERPVVLLIDNAHWAGPGISALVSDLGVDVRHRRLFMVVAHRSELAGPAAPPGTTRMLLRLARQFGDHSIDLDAGRMAEEQALVDQLVDSEPNVLSGAFRARLAQESRAIPLFAAELLRDLALQQVLTRDRSGRFRAPSRIRWTSTPARIIGLLEERLGYAPADDLRLLRAASVVGVEFAADTIAHASATSLDDVVQAFSVRLADRGLRLVESTNGTRGRGPSYRFRHPMLQTHLEGTLDAGERSHLRAMVERASKS